MHEVTRAGRRIIRGTTMASSMRQGAEGNSVSKKKKRKHWSALESDSDGESSMHTQTRRSTHKTS